MGIITETSERLDSLGLICGYPTIAPGRIVKAQGRVKLPTGTPSGPALSICEKARKARARNSPAAPGLEAQCRVQEQGAITDGLRPGDTVSLNPQPLPPGSDSPTAQDSTQTRAAQTGIIIVSGKDAQVRSAQAIDVNGLSAKGEAIASRDPLALDLRNDQPTDAARTGFDIGMAVAEGHTLPGPGKQKLHDQLGEGQSSEIARQMQSGFATAVSFSLERNRNLRDANVGAAIAIARPSVAAVRNSEPNVFYRLGFDIASGRFGDPSIRDAEGNKSLGFTAFGPGSQNVRNSLSAAGRRGFNASMALHLSNDYRPEP